MSRTSTLIVSDDVYAALRGQAETTGISPARLAATSLEQQFGREGAKRDSGRLRDKAGHQASRQQFARHFGAIDLGHATGADNESIDADLARAYAGTHESP